MIRIMVIYKAQTYPAQSCSRQFVSQCISWLKSSHISLCKKDAIKISLNFTLNMMTSSNGNIFSVTGPLCGEFTGQRGIPRTKASDAEIWCFLWSAPWINDWVNNRKVVTGEFPAQKASNAANVCIWWRHHDNFADLTKWETVVYKCIARGKQPMNGAYDAYFIVFYCGLVPA